MNLPIISFRMFQNRLFSINRNSYPYTDVSFMDNLIRDIYFMNRSSGVVLNARNWTIQTLRNYEENGLIFGSERFLNRFDELESSLGEEYDANFVMVRGARVNRIAERFGSVPLMSGTVL